MDNGIYTSKELKLVQDTTLRILKCIDEICCKEGIEYFIMYGTLLGAKRHKGFIPWDDDVDIVMTYPNYLKFKEIADTLNDYDLFYQSFETDYKYPQIYAKVRMNGTKFKEWKNRSIKMHHGIFVDIFPWVDVPSNNEERGKINKKIKKLDELYFLRQCPNILNQPNGIKDNVKNIIKHIVRIPFLLMPPKIIYNYIENQYHDCSKYNTDFLAYLGYNQIFCKNDIYPLKRMKFGDIEVYAPQNEDKILTQLYGDYMKLPPMDQRVGHKPWLIEISEDSLKYSDRRK